MKHRNINTVPLVMTILSALYLLYVCSSEETAMNADAVGGDPGGKFLPTIMGVFLFCGFLGKTIKERPQEGEHDPVSRRLFVLTLVISLLYIVLLRYIGFIILSVLLLYVLLYAYTTIDEPRRGKEAACGCLATEAATIAAYYLFRFVSRKLLHLGRSGALPVFRSNVPVAVVALAIVLGLTVLLSRTACPALRRHGHGRVATAGVVSFATVLLLYVVFRQFFLVTLAPGLLTY